MDARKIALVQESFERVAAMGDAAAEIFYAELFEIDPSLKTLFTDMSVQRRKLLAALAFTTRSLHAHRHALVEIERLAIMHTGYGVRIEHYTYFGNALLRTLRALLGRDFTPELCDAWIEAFQMLTRIMKEAAYGRSPLASSTTG